MSELYERYPRLVECEGAISTAFEILLACYRGGGKALTGAGGGRLGALADAAICVPETETYRIQELHLPVYHAICAALEEAFSANIVPGLGGFQMRHA